MKHVRSELKNRRKWTGLTGAVAAMTLTAALYTNMDEIASSAAAAQSSGACSAAKLAEVRAQATPAANMVKVDCDLTLQPSDVITKRIRVEKSNVDIDCRGATINAPDEMIAIEILSRKSSTSANGYIKTQYVSVRNCKINSTGGGIRVGSSIFSNGTEDIHDDPDKKADWTQVVRAINPARVTLDNLHINIQHSNSEINGKALHIFLGTTYVKLTNSVLTGRSKDVSIYMSPESAYNQIRNNTINTERAGNREQIAVDGSAYNVIAGNDISNLQKGGIYLFRNCGEKGMIRHLTPSNNQIINNVFFGSSSYPSIHVSSRDGDNYYCDYDKGYPFGSSINDGSLAKNNVVAENQFVNRSVSSSLKVSYDPNILIANQQVGGPVSRLSGCYVKNGLPEAYIASGGYVDRFKVNGHSACTGYKFTCNDGIRTRVDITCPGVTPPPPPSNQTCTLDGLTWSSGTSRTFYKLKSSSSCAANSQVRACNNGVVSGSNDYKYKSCSAPQPPTNNKSCTLDGVTWASGTSKTFYKVRESNTCSAHSQVRMCNDGKVGGTATFKYKSCEVPPLTTAQARTIVTASMKNVLGRTQAEINSDTSGMNYWINQLKGGLTKAQMENSFRASDEYFVRNAYQTHLKRRGSWDEVQYWVNQIVTKKTTRTGLVNTLKYYCTHHIGGECQ